MHAIVLTDNQHSELEALNGLMPFALLPVAGKQIILHVLEQLHRSNIRSVTVVSRDSHSQLDAVTHTETLLGMSVTLTSQPPAPGLLDDEILLIGINQLIDVNWKTVTAMQTNTPRHSVTKLTTGASETIAFVLGPQADKQIPDSWGDCEEFADHSVSIGSPDIVRIDTLTDYQTANFRILQGRCQHLRPAGREKSPGLYTAHKVYVSPRIMKGDHAYIGVHSRVHEQVSLHGDVVIGDHVFIDKGAKISNSIILDGTYIGAMTHIDDAIVHENILIKVKSGLRLTIDDPLLLSKAI